MHPFIGISRGGGGVNVSFFITGFGGGGVGGYMYCLSVPVCGEWGDVYDLNIESKINLAGNAILKIYVLDYLKK